MIFGHSKGWYNALVATGMNPAATDEAFTSTHYHLYLRVMTPNEDLFETILSYELDGDDPRCEGFFLDAATQAMRRLMGHLTLEN